MKDQKNDTHYPGTFWEAYKTTPSPVTSTFRPFINNTGESERQYLDKKIKALKKVKEDLIKEEEEYNRRNTDEPDW
jgi:hypothetical protein